MKKFLSFLAVAVVAGSLGTASAMDRSGKIGLGAQESFGSNGSFGSSALGAWSVKYGVNSNVTAQFLVGFDMVSKGGDKSFDIGARLLYDLVEKENSDFYTGLGFGWTQDKAPVDNRDLRIQIPLGWEFSFAGLPEVGFSAEVGVMIDYVKASKAISFRSVGGNVGGNLGLGVHYYF